MARKSKSNDVERANRDAYFRTTKAPGVIELTKGERVAYTVYFLRQIGMSHGEMASRRGTVIDPMAKLGSQDTFAMVQWDGDDEPTMVSRHTLACPGANLRFCAG
jgi:hypothetical protein